jgi:demethylmenaquinone methyltransferase/2-methoxy-6-polyprenyl-1,4-benzoquinol methylase
VQAGGTRWLDACGGTGEMAANLLRSAGPDTNIFVADFSDAMIRRSIEKPALRRIILALADVKALPFRDDTFDLVTISFATRNINVTEDHLMQSLREFYRILKPGGVFVNLETSQPSSLIIKRLFHLYVRLFVRPLGHLFSGSRTGYAYLARTIPRFHDAEDYADIIQRAGFGKIDVHRLMLGAVAIHRAVK